MKLSCVLSGLAAILTLAAAAPTPTKAGTINVKICDEQNLNKRGISLQLKEPDRPDRPFINWGPILQKSCNDQCVKVKNDSCEPLKSVGLWVPDCEAINDQCAKFCNETILDKRGEEAEPKEPKEPKEPREPKKPITSTANSPTLKQSCNDQCVKIKSQSCEPLYSAGLSVLGCEKKNILKDCSETCDDQIKDEELLWI